MNTDADAVHIEASEWFAEHWDPARSVREWWRLLADSGWAFPTWPTEYGGRGLDKAGGRAAVLARKEAGAFGPPNGVATFLVAPTVMHYGSEEQQARHLPGIVDGTTPWCQLFSEPGAGSDIAGLATRAVRDGDEWIVNGQKVWSSGAQHAKRGILIARTDPDQPKHRGITFFLIDMEQPGVEVRPLREMTGAAAFNEVFFTEARVHESDRLGELGEGWRVAMTTLSHERDPDNAGLGDTPPFATVDLDEPVGKHAATIFDTVDGFSLAMMGQAGPLFDRAVNEHADTSDPVFRQELMKLVTERRTSRLSAQRAAAAVKAGGQPGPEVSTLKLKGAALNRQMRDVGLGALGPAAMLDHDDAPIDGLFHRYALFTPAASIAGGSDEVQHNIIGERILGLPREPGEAEQRELPWKDLPRS
ncbi:MAG: acyl-CoA dehydrogenase family protein [Acidimicrobiales bacterium]|jgi:alkylation response protein AidB-like acyl-CoA dehydrogenase|nr:acyl-CoA dehydrogenase family protein [Acidimicrobiales bacterium]